MRTRPALYEAENEAEAEFYEAEAETFGLEALTSLEEVIVCKYSIKRYNTSENDLKLFIPPESLLVKSTL